MRRKWEWERKEAGKHPDPSHKPAIVEIQVQ